MPISVITFFTKYWKVIVVAGAIFVMYLYWSDRTNQIEELREIQSKLTAEIVLKDAQYAENARKFKAEIADQNEKIRQAAEEFVELETKSSLLIAAETARNDERQRRLQEQIALLQSLPTPETCETSIGLLVDIGVANPWVKN